jgi:hypothetical protein
MSNIIPVRNDAPLPATYEAAQRALAECQRIDECRDWANKAHALASYARQAKDDSLRLTAIRIQNRAIRRAGELLKQIEPSKGGRPTETQKGDHPSCLRARTRAGSVPISRTVAAEQAGLSEHQRKTAIRVANVPAPVFEAAVESAKPPTVTELAVMGTNKLPQPLRASTAPSADRSTVITALNLLRDLAAFSTQDAARIARAVQDPDFARGLVKTIDVWLDKFVTNLPADDAGDASCRSSV